MAGSFDGFGGFGFGRSSLRLGAVVGHGFHFVSIAEKCSEIRFDGIILVREEAERRPQTAMCFDSPACALEQNGMRGVKRSKVCLTAGDLREAETRIRDGIIEVSPRSREEAFCLRCHKSIPSRRTSPMNAVGSL